MRKMARQMPLATTRCARKQAVSFPHATNNWGGYSRHSQSAVVQRMYVCVFIGRSTEFHNAKAIKEKCTILKKKILQILAISLCCASVGLI